MRDLITFCHGVIALLPGHMEVVVHDLQSQRISHIAGNFSNRKVGDESLLDAQQLELDLSDQSILGPYTKLDPRLGKIRCVSIRLDTDQGPQLVCINMCIQPMLGAVEALSALLACQETQISTDSLLKNDWRESINRLIYQSLSAQGVTPVSAKKAHRLTVLEQLQETGLLQMRGAAEHVMTTLGIAKATYFNLLKTVRNKT